MLVHVYSIGYMAHDPGYWRFFAYLNLFMFSMLLLVLADNFLVIFVAWELVGLSSYLLIGFWYKRRSAALAAKKAFIVNRVGDVGFALGIVAIIGIFTTILAASIAFTQTDIKRVLAYSTLSQLGYMFAALGVGAWTAAIFHLMSHGFFKGLLFLDSGSVIHAVDGEQDMRRM